MLLALIALVVVFLNPKSFNQNAAKNSTSSTPAVVQPAATLAPVIKDNKTIEITSNTAEFAAVEHKFDVAQITDREFAGISGAKVFSSPEINTTSKTKLYVVNSTFNKTEQATLAFGTFNGALNRNTTLKNTEYYRILDIFRDIDAIGGYQKEFVSDITIAKPAAIDAIRAMFTQDGIQFPSPPTVTIMGKSGNDYFVIENKLTDIDHVKLGEEAKAACEVGGDTVNECVIDKYNKAILPITTPEYLVNKSNEALSFFKFQ